MDAKKRRGVVGHFSHNESDDAFRLVGGFETKKPKSPIWRGEARFRDLRGLHEGQIISRRGGAVFDDDVVWRALHAIDATRKEPESCRPSDLVDDGPTPAVLTDQHFHVSGI